MIWQARNIPHGIEKQMITSSLVHDGFADGETAVGALEDTCATLPVHEWRPAVDAQTQKEAALVVESGRVLLLPALSFPLTKAEETFLRPDSVSARTKSVKYALDTDRMWGMAEPETDAATLQGLLRRYADSARDLIGSLFPDYMPRLVTGNTSFRPVEAQARTQSLRQDDRLLHVDAFPSRPSKGHRLLRVFTNINPEGKPRVWRVGERFESLAARLAPRLPAPLPGSAMVLKALRITKQRRTAYDHYMLQMHDAMKRDAAYQQNGRQAVVSFPARCSWIVFTDQVPHAAVSGQHAMEQTFTLPPDAQYNPQMAPVRVLETLLGKKLI